jgi:hypothetical protein
MLAAHSRVIRTELSFAISPLVQPSVGTNPIRSSPRRKAKWRAFHPRATKGPNLKPPKSSLSKQLVGTKAAA